jgi:HK97 family phage prohead protease
MPDSTAATLVNPINDSLSQLVDKNAVIRKLDLREERGGRRIIAGYANVANIQDSQGDIITLEALRNAWDKWSANPDFCLLSLLHSNIPLAKVVFEDVVDSKGVTHRSGVNDTGLYVVAEVRDDVTVADDVWRKIESGEFRGYSIGGRNLNPQPTQCAGDKCSRQITNLELYEVAIVDKPANEVSLFNMVKSDDLAKLAEATRGLGEQILAEGAVKISKRPCPVTGKYRVVVGAGIDASKLFSPDKFALTDKTVEGEEYVSLFDTALLRPESVLTGTDVGGGVNPSPLQAATPDTPNPPSGITLEEKKPEEVKTEPSKKDESEPPKTPEAIAPITLETLMAELARVTARLDDMEKIRKSAAPAEPPKQAEPPKPAEPAKETPPPPAPAPPVEPPKAEAKPAEPPAPVPTPAPAAPPPKEEPVGTRGVTQPPAPGNVGLNLGELYSKVTWGEIHEAMEASQKRK